MSRLNSVAGIILVLIVGFLVQVLFTLADTRDTPNKAVTEFTKAYFELDPSMANRICKKQLTSGEVNIVDQYLYLAEKEAKEQGFNINWMKNKLYHIKTRTISKSDTQAQIEITGKIRTSINSVYTVIAQLFNIGESHEIDTTFNVIKENGKWKVCGNLSSLYLNRG